MPSARSASKTMVRMQRRQTEQSRDTSSVSLKVTLAPLAKVRLVEISACCSIIAIAVRLLRRRSHILHSILRCHRHHDHEASAFWFQFQPRVGLWNARRCHANGEHRRKQEKLDDDLSTEPPSRNITQSKMDWQPAPDLIRLFDAQWPLMRDLHRQGSLAPCGASTDLDGVVHGEAFIVENPAEDPRAEWVVRHLAQRYRQLLNERRIRVAGVFFHGERFGQYVDFASSMESANAIVAIMEQADGQSALSVVQYAWSDDGWQYSLPAAFYPAGGLPSPSQYSA